MSTGDTTLAFCAENALAFDIAQNRQSKKPAGIEIALIADDVHLAYKTACEAGAEPLKEPETKPWGQVVSYVKDLDGCLVEICSVVAST